MSDDDWDTDPDFVNDVSEKQQRWGNKGSTIATRITVLSLHFSNSLS
jgi:cortactin